MIDNSYFPLKYHESTSASNFQIFASSNIWHRLKALMLCESYLWWYPRKMEGSRPLSGVIMSLSDIYSATSHLPTRTLHQYPYSPRFSTESCLRIEQVGVDEKSTMFNCENTPKQIIFINLSTLRRSGDLFVISHS